MGSEGCGVFASFAELTRFRLSIVVDQRSTVENSCREMHSTREDVLALPMAELALRLDVFAGVAQFGLAVERIRSPLRIDEVVSTGTSRSEPASRKERLRVTVIEELGTTILRNEIEQW